MARRTASAKWAEGPALAGRRGTLLVLGLNEGLGFTGLKAAKLRSVKRLPQISVPEARLGGSRLDGDFLAATAAAERSLCPAGGGGRQTDSRQMTD